MHFTCFKLIPCMHTLKLPRIIVHELMFLYKSQTHLNDREMTATSNADISNTLFFNGRLRGCTQVLNHVMYFRM